MEQPETFSSEIRIPKIIIFSRTNKMPGSDSLPGISFVGKK
jgi:hypothetical protein